MFSFINLHQISVPWAQGLINILVSKKWNQAGLKPKLSLYKAEKCVRGRDFSEVTELGPCGVPPTPSSSDSVYRVQELRNEGQLAGGEEGDVYNSSHLERAR